MKLQLPSTAHNEVFNGLMPGRHEGSARASNPLLTVASSPAGKSRQCTLGQHQSSVHLSLSLRFLPNIMHAHRQQQKILSNYQTLTYVGSASSSSSWLSCASTQLHSHFCCYCCSCYCVDVVQLCQSFAAVAKVLYSNAILACSFSC